MIGLLGLSALIGVILLVHWLSKFDVDDDFDERERH